ncbi:MAG: isoprenyl transferase [Proteobacteria bacterium]|nr:isoprenyl transferase [Pseudomonadota bacterium]
MEPLPHSSDLPGPPTHVAVIMDGNARWAKARGLPTTAGHRAGAEAVRRIVRAAPGFGIRFLTLFGFSTENWKRPAGEVRDLMELLRFYLKREIVDLHEKGVRIRMIGDRDRLERDIVALMEDAETLTRANRGLQLTIALSYGARQEIVAAARRLADKAVRGELAPEEIDLERFADSLLTRDVPDPDVIIRTSGERRLSNFLLWQSAYSELIFVDTLWPDFSEHDLEDVIREFHRRERRYGARVG